MKYVALFENWQEPFMDRYNRAVKLFDLGLVNSPLAFDSPLWEDFKRIVADELEKRDYDVEELFGVTDNRATLEISYTDQYKSGPPDTKYLRYAIMQKIDEPAVMYLVSANYLQALSIKDPIHIIDEIVRLADLYLKPEKSNIQ
jgi:hypothetical protein